MTRFNNILLNQLDAQELDCLAAHFATVPLPALEVLAEPGKSVSHVYFVETGIVSIISKLDDERDVEVGLIGYEGMTGDALALGDHFSPYGLHVQTPGYAQAIEADRFEAALKASRSLHDFMLKFVRAQSAQTASTIATNRRSTLEERLARCILMTFDRIEGASFRVTHESLAWILGSRRPGVTDALHLLEGKGLIRANRTEILILDPGGLEQLSRGAYGFAEREYRRLFGIDFRLRSHETSSKMERLITPKDRHDLEMN